MSITYKRDEIVSATTVAKSFGKVLSDIENHRKEKIVVAKNNKLNVVILNIDDYESMAELQNIMEHVEIYQIIKKRLLKHSIKRIDIDVLLKEEKIEL